MINLKYIEELEEYIRSGTMEDNFAYSPEERRHEILEFLEKLMDVAELADEAVTRIIFKGRFDASAIESESTEGEQVTAGSSTDKNH